MDQQVAPIPVFRPPFLTDGGEFRGSLIESPANVFYQQVKASRATLNRMQFQWRSVSDSLLLSPLVRLRFQLDITCPQVWTQDQVPGDMVPGAPVPCREGCASPFSAC